MAQYTIGYPGPPTTGIYSVFDSAVDPNGIVWSCSVAGSPGTWLGDTLNNFVATAPLALAGHKITGLSNGSGASDGAAYGQLNDSSGRAAFSTPTPTTGSAFVPLATGDCQLYIKCVTSTTIVVTMGPSTGAENSVVASVTAPVGGFYSIVVPKNWKVVVTATIADFTFTAQAL